MKSSQHLDLILVFIEFISFTYSVPHEFCLDQFDDRNCNKTPIDVFYYYKPASRCEIRKWRGCPTRNKFPDQYLCSHYCIGRLIGYVDEPEEGGYNMTNNEIKPVAETKEEWVEELNKLNIAEIEELDEILDDVIEETDRQHKKTKLSFINHITTTEATINRTTKVQELPPEEPKGTEKVTEDVTEKVTEEITEKVTEEVTKATTKPEPEVEQPTEAPQVTEDDSQLIEGSGGDDKSGPADEVILP